MVYWVRIQTRSTLSSIISFLKLTFYYYSSPFFKWYAHVTPCQISFNWRDCSEISRNPSIKQFQVVQCKFLFPPDEISDTFPEINKEWQININLYNGLTILDFRIWSKYMIKMDGITHKVLHQIYGLFFFLYH